MKIREVFQEAVIIKMQSELALEKEKGKHVQSPCGKNINMLKL